MAQFREFRVFRFMGRWAGRAQNRKTRNSRKAARAVRPRRGRKPKTESAMQKRMRNLSPDWVSASRSAKTFRAANFHENAFVCDCVRPPLRRNGFCNLGRFRRLRRTGPWRSGCVLSGPAGSVDLPLTKPKIRKLGSGCVAYRVSSLPMLWPAWPANCNNGRLSQLIPAQCSECSDFQPAPPTDPSTRRL
jgi:hypothetical protein